MKLSKRVFYALLLFTILFSILLRYPLGQHECGSDSFAYHGLSREIASSGYAPWLVHPISPFGLYPYSTNAGLVFLIAGISQLINFEVEFTILIVGIIFGIFSTFAAYLLGKEIIKNNFFALLFAFVYQATNLIVKGTTWTFEMRVMFIIILPLFIWALLRSYNQPRNRIKYILLSILIFIILGTIHKIWFISFLFIFAYFAAIPIYKHRKTISSKRIKKALSMGYVSSILFLLFMPLIGFDFYAPSLDFYKHGHFFQGNAFYIILVNVGIEYSMALSILVIFIPVGIAYLLLKKNKTIGEIFVLVLPLFCVSFMFDQLYSRTILVFVFSLLIGLGIFCSTSFISKIKKMHHLTIPLILLLLIVSAFLPYFVVVRTTTSTVHIGVSSTMDDETYNTALFADKYMKGDVYVCSDSILDRRIDCLSDAQSLTALSGPGEVIYGFVDLDNVSIKRIEFTDPTIYGRTDWWFNLLYYKGQLYKSENPSTYYYYSILIRYDCEDVIAKKYIEEYNIQYVILNDHTNGKTVIAIERDVAELLESPFYNSVIRNNYKIYDDGLESIYNIGSNNR